MALITRVSRLFRADVNAVLERMEEPALLLRQAVREMEEALERDEQRARLLAPELQRIAARQGELARSVAEIGDELDFCFDTGNDALARVLLKRRLEIERFVKFLNRRHEELRGAADELKQRIDHNRSRLENMRQKAELLVDQDAADEAAGGWSDPEFVRRFTVSDDDVELAFLREQRKRVRS